MKSSFPPDIQRLQLEVDKLQRAQMAAGTEKGYAHDWRTFRAWCERAGRQPLPASPETLKLFLADELARKKVATVCRYGASIAFHHRREGLPSPVDDSVRATLRGARRMRAERPRQMRPLTVNQLREALTVLSGQTTAMAARNRAILLIGFATGLRRLNLSRLRMEEVTFHQEGVVILARREKQDRAGTGRLVAAPFGQHELTCPVRAVEAWLALRGREPGPLFTRLDSASTGKLNRLSPNAIWKIVKRAIGAAGIDPREYGPHSLRSGIITAAAIAGVSALVVANHVGHTSLDSTNRYFRPTDLFRANPAGLIGL